MVPDPVEECRIERPQVAAVEGVVPPDRGSVDLQRFVGDRAPSTVDDESQPWGNATRDRDPLHAATGVQGRRPFSWTVGFGGRTHRVDPYSAQVTVQ
jgi:hypothetical protein